MTPMIANRRLSVCAYVDFTGQLITGISLRRMMAGHKKACEDSIPW
jgi:hypothetical protein